MPDTLSIAEIRHEHATCTSSVGDDGEVHMMLAHIDALTAAHVIAAHTHDWDCAVGGHETDPHDCPECDHLRAAFAEEPHDA